MSDLSHALAAFAAADTESWPGLPTGLRLSDLAPLVDLDPDDRRSGELGSPPTAAEWVPAASGVYAGGLRLWLAGGAVAVLEGIHPLDAAGEFRPAPDLGPPAAALETRLGSLHLAGGELVYPGRGLAVRVNPDNGLLLGLVGFAPSSLGDYRRRLRPVQEVARPRQPVVVP